ncbi:MAG TPA: ATP-binding cassette domain-containing protein [Coriobacteriia bacterium]|jgi:energy-coupling factor transporter ATPase
MIELSEVTFRYPGAAMPALAGVTLSLAPGELVAVVGANGSGKSTLALLCDGLLLPERGTVSVDGVDTRDETRVFEVRSRVGLVLQDPDDQIVGTVVEEDTAFGPENLGVPRQELRRRVDDALSAVGLSGLERREPHLLSEGQKQRLAIAGALAMRPGYLVLDEPTAMLDPRGRADVAAILARLAAEGTGVLHVTHRLADAVAASRVVALSEGTVAYDGPAEGLLGDAALMASLGVSPPPLAELSAALRLLGVDVPAGADTPSAVLEALWG